MVPYSAIAGGIMKEDASASGSLLKILKVRSVHIIGACFAVLLGF